MVRVFFANRSLRGEAPSRYIVMFCRCTSFRVDFEKVWSIFESDGFLSSNIARRPAAGLNSFCKPISKGSSLL
jgi:hypothetical protein